MPGLIGDLSLAPAFPKVCFCGTEFTPVRSDQKYCTPVCQKRSCKQIGKMDGNAVKAKARDLNECRLCGGTEQLVIHHLDGTGEDDSPNHTLENLVTLCRKCHMATHRMDYRIINGEIVIHSPLPRLV